MQLGKALDHILQQIAYTDPTHGPPLLQKFNLSHSYYHVRLSPEVALELAVVIPGFNQHQTLIAIPLCYQMEWTHSPPYFCAFMETIADVCNTKLIQQIPHPPHHLEISSQDHDVPCDPTFMIISFIPPSNNTIPPHCPMLMSS